MIYLFLGIVALVLITILEQLIGSFVWLVIGVLAAIWVIRHWRDVLDFIIAIIPIVIIGGIIAGILAVLITLAY